MLVGIEFGKFNEVILANFVVSFAEQLNFGRGFALVVEDDGSPAAKSISSFHARINRNQTFRKQFKENMPEYIQLLLVTGILGLVA